MKRNEYFVFPGDGFNPAEVDLMDPSNRSRISPHLFRVHPESVHTHAAGSGVAPQCNNWP